MDYRERNYYLVKIRESSKGYFRWLIDEVVRANAKYRSPKNLLDQCRKLNCKLGICFQPE